MALQSIGKYELLEELGRGGFAVVYKARDTTLDRVVALKVLHPHWVADPGFSERFRQEARAAANLRHANIVTVYEAGEADGQLFIAMEYLPGRTLHDSMEAEGALSLDATLPILAQIADALDYAHGQGVIHRDVKPHNVMVEQTARGPHATLMDFGLVKAMEISTALTSRGTLLGSPEYMAPEQADPNRHDEIGPATDCYALGILTYRMLVGRVPFPGNTPGTLNAHQNLDVPDPRRFVQDLPQAVIDAMLTMLAKAPAARFPTAGTFVARLQGMPEVRLAPTMHIQTSALKQKVKRQPAPRPPQYLIDQITVQNVIPIIGTGFSTLLHVEGINDPVIPDYDELLDRLTKEAENLGVNVVDMQRIRHALANGDTKSAARNLIGVMDYDFYRVLRSIFNPIESRILPSPAHKLLRILGFRHIVTTNYDRLLEKFVGPNYEVITPMDEKAFQFFAECLWEHSANRYILKIHGDITRPETIFWGEARLRRFYDSDAMSLRDFLAEIFTRKTILFLGYPFYDDGEEPLYFLKEYSKHAGKPTRRHYALVPHNPVSKSWRESLTEKIGITFLEYIPDENHSQVWEFISFLNTGKQDVPIAGEKWAQWYLPSQRHNYLKCQLSLERTARAVCFLTPTLTNSIATDEYLDVFCRSKMKTHRLIPDDEENARYIDYDIIPLMVERRNNLEEGLHKGRLEVKALFLKNELDKEFIEPHELTIERYRHLIGLLKDLTIDLEVRLIPDLISEQFEKYETGYALIYGDLPKPRVDVAIAYASQSTINYSQIHMIEINTETVKDRSFLFEQFWASAWSEQDSVAYIERLVTSK